MWRGLHRHMTSSRIPVEGSGRPPVPGAEPIAEVDSAKRAEVTVTLPSRAEPDPDERVSREEFAERYGADPAAIERLETFASEHRLDVVSADPARRSVVLAGSLDDL